MSLLSILFPLFFSLFLFAADFGTTHWSGAWRSAWIPVSCGAAQTKVWCIFCLPFLLRWALPMGSLIFQFLCLFSPLIFLSLCCLTANNEGFSLSLPPFLLLSLSVSVLFSLFLSLPPSLPPPLSLFLPYFLALTGLLLAAQWREGRKCSVVPVSLSCSDAVNRMSTP